MLKIAAGITGQQSVLGQHLDALELHLPELSGFYSIIAIPHFAWAAALMAWGIVGLLGIAGATNMVEARSPLALATGSLLALTVIHPQMLFVLAPLAGFHLWRGHRPPRAWAMVAIPFVACLPLLLYFLRVLTGDPVIVAWSAQWRHQAPEALGFVCALGLPLALAAVAVAARGLTPRLALMAAWVALVLVMLYLPNPVNIQRRLIDGIYLPVAMLAAAGLEVIIRRRGSRPRGAFRRPGPIATLAVGVSLVMSLLVWAAGMSAAIGQEPIIYVDSGEVAAIDWLSSHRDAGLPAAVLSHPNTGLFIPERSGYRVYVGHYSETIDYLAKAQAAFAAFRDGGTVPLMQREGATFLFYGPLEREAGGPPPAGDRLDVVYDRDGVRIYRLRG
jgi:hypothetical protein